MTNGFTQKEMLVRLMDKMDCFEKKTYEKLDKVNVKINETHELATTTNGKVKLHTKLIMGIGGALIVIVGWIISIILK
ncbi:MAG: hypothetical protein ACFFG0_03090 [Candidatus Thorarchaeota archaeon]